MATEFRLNYTGSEINQKLAAVDAIQNSLENNYYTSVDVNEKIETKIAEVNTSIEETNASVEEMGALINQTNTSIEEINTSIEETNVSIEGIRSSIEETNAAIESGLIAKADLINGRVPVEQLPDLDLGATSWDDLEDRPFYEKNISFVWDGDVTEIDTLLAREEEGTYFVYAKISDTPLSDVNDLIGGRYGIMQDTGEVSYGTIQVENINAVTDNIYSVDLDGVAGIVNVTATDTTDVFGSTLIFDTGVYFIGVFASNMDTQAMFYVTMCENVAIKQIDPKFISANLDINLDNYYTKDEIDEITENLDGGNGGGVTSWNDLEDKPFEDTRVRSYYSQAENPNPTSFDFEAMNYTFYKVSDLILTKEQILNELRCCRNNISGSDLREFGFLESGIQLETDEFVFVISDTGSYGFIFINTAGTLNFTYSGYEMSFDVPEAGIYYPVSLGNPMREHTFEFVCGGNLKTLEPKFIPDMYYDTREIYRFDSSATPNPPSYSIDAFEATGYKIFDYTPSKEEFLNLSIQHKGNNGGTPHTFLQKQIMIDFGDDGFMVVSDRGYSFGLCRRAGTYNGEYNGFAFTCEVPETGIYYINTLYSGMIFEINLGGDLKPIDDKFIPNTIARKSDLDSVSVDLSNYYTKSEVDTALDNVSVDLSGYYTKSDIDEIIGDIDAVINEINTLIGE